MNPFSDFELVYQRDEEHLIMPTRSSILVTQQLYDILFQYCISKEKEEKLLAFIHLMEKHIKSKVRAPFSFPVEELADFEEGVEEMRLLSWFDRPVHIFQLKVNGGTPAGDELDMIIGFLETIMTCKWNDTSGELYVYPADLVW